MSAMADVERPTFSPRLCEVLDRQLADTFTEYPHATVVESMLGFGPVLGARLPGLVGTARHHQIGADASSACVPS